jgi:O-antigen ligase
VLGRIYFSGQEARVQLITVIAAGLAVLAPIALLEGIMGPKLYGWLYELHPFRFDGAQRYVGFRPLGFFEHGNQYGIWVAATALAAVWLWRTEPVRGRFGAVAALALAITLLSQSVGAILLLFGGLALLWRIGSSMKRWVLPLILALIISGATLYLTRALPLRAFAENTMIGRQIVGLARSAGRESFTWRIARDQEALALVSDHPIAGTGQWDWWRQDEGRPWDLAVLIFGQFGLIGLVLALGSLLAPAVRALYDRGCLALRRNLPEVPLATIVLMGVADMLLNSFILYPAILAAGALVPMNQSKLKSDSVDHRS